METKRTNITKNLKHINQMNRFVFFMKLLIPYIYNSDIVIYSKIWIF